MSAAVLEKQQNPSLEFVWMELTNQCNLQCKHCYAESGPRSDSKDLLTEDDYVRLLREVRELGCPDIQFIGGEPTLNKSLPRLIREASSLGFKSIEVFTNLLALPQSLLKVFVKYNVSIATSFYSHDPEIHDAITTSQGSFKRTVANIKRVIESGLTIRAGIIVMDENQPGFKETWEFLEALGIKNIGTDHIRHFGRASRECDGGDMKQLCGSCSGNILSIGPDGVVAPCNMSKSWSVGSVVDTGLRELVESTTLANIRKQIGDAVKDSEQIRPQAVCTPKTCAPYSSCCPSTQQCGPCAPNGCSPCYPKG